MTTHEDLFKLDEKTLEERMVEIAYQIEATGNPMKLYELYYSEYDWRYQDKRNKLLLILTISNVLVAIIALLISFMK